MPRTLDTATWNHFVPTDSPGKIAQRACKHCGKKVPAVSRTRAVQHLHKCAVFNQGVASGQYDFPAPPVPRNTQPFPTGPNTGATFTFPAVTPYTPTAPPPRLGAHEAPRSAPHVYGTLPAPAQPTFQKAPPLDSNGGGKEALDRLAAKAVHECGLPFGVFQFPAMVDFLKRLNPTYQPPTSDHLRRKLLDQVYGDSAADPLLLASSQAQRDGEPHELQLLVDAMESDDAIPGKFPQRRETKLYHPDMPLGLESLPPSELERFIDAYFDVYHVSNPIIHEATFRAQYSKVIPRPGNLWEVLQYMVAALGCACISSSGDQKTAGLLFEAAHAKLTLDAIEGSSILLVQILALVGNYLQMTNKSHAANNFLGLAKRMAVRIGLHRDHSNSSLSPWQNEMRRRVWWCLFNIDFPNLLAWFRPYDESAAAVDTAYPLNINDADLTVAAGRYPREVQTPTVYSFTRVQAQLFTAVQSIYSRIARGDVPHPAQLVRLDDEHIGSWLANLPPYFQEFAIQQPRFELPHALLRWRFRHFRIFMYRPYVVRKVIYKAPTRPASPTAAAADPPPVDRAVQRCWQAARESIDLIRGLLLVSTERRPALFVAHALFYLVQAAAIPLMLLRNDPAALVADDWRAQLAQALEVLDRCAPDHAVAKRAAATLRRDAQAYLDRRAGPAPDPPDAQLWSLNQSAWQAGASLFPSYAAAQQDAFLLDFFHDLPGFA